MTSDIFRTVTSIATFVLKVIKTKQKVNFALTKTPSTLTEAAQIQGNIKFNMNVFHLISFRELLAVKLAIKRLCLKSKLIWTV